MDDLNHGGRDLEPQDHIGNAGDQAGDTAGNVGDDIRSGLGDLGGDTNRGADQTYPETQVSDKHY